jgi:hypothetical protein
MSEEAGRHGVEGAASAGMPTRPSDRQYSPMRLLDIGAGASLSADLSW